MTAPDDPGKPPGAGPPLPSPEPMVGGAGGMELVWRCLECGHLLQRAASPPDRCPDCGAPREHFLLLTED